MEAAMECAINDEPHFDEDVPPWPLGLSLCPTISGGHDILLGDRFRTKLTYTLPLLHASI
jgi:hypothetical protein